MKAFRILAAGLAGLSLAAMAHAEGGAAAHPHEPDGGWEFDGLLGQFDMPSVQRGYQVYREVCSSCHSMKLMSYRNLGEPGGPFFDPEYPNANENPFLKALAADVEIQSPTPNDIGDYDFRPATPADQFRSPYANENAGRAANNGAAPPDLSVIVKARHGGASYIYSLLSGYPSEDAISTREVSPAVVTASASDNGTPDDPSDDMAEVATPAVMQTVIDMSKVHIPGHEAAEGEHGDAGILIQPAGQFYNPFMAGDTTPQFEGDPRKSPAGGFLAMGPQLAPGRVTYTDPEAPEATAEQMAHDVAQFLAWASEPKQTNRKSLGLPVMIYLVILAILLWFSYKRIWRKVDH
ncbi:cytochrome c1 [Hyphomonas sp.]|jgi:ubiquinol-cytochrome c reductase cytochrome c1 subunit|uniref:cytochrome c1 n=1 Tax=Hyphomonas sp. TaxID=87 RepID=UPI0039E25553